MAKFLVPMWWLELHCNDFIVEADTPKEAEEKAILKFHKGEFEYNTFVDYSQFGFDEIVEMKEEPTT